MNRFIDYMTTYGQVTAHLKDYSSLTYVSSQLTHVPSQLTFVPSQLTYIDRPISIVPNAESGRIRESLLQMLEAWKQLHVSDLKNHGFEAFAKLLHRPLDSLPTFKYNYYHEPTMAHVIRDFLAAGQKIALTPVHSGVGNFKPNDFLTSLIALFSNPGADPANRMQTPLVAWNVPATKDGLGQCGISLPHVLLECDVFVSPVCMGCKLPSDYRRRDPLFHTIIKPAGTLLDVRDDGTLTANVLIQVEGHTALLTWPRTDSNLQFYEQYHCTQHPFILSTALDSMTGLKLTILSPGMGVVMDPGMLYAEMSSGNSATGGWCHRPYI